MICSRYKNSHGFSVIETLVVIALTSLLAGISAWSTVNAYRHTLGQSDVYHVISAVTHTREQAMHGVCRIACEGPSVHGIAVHARALTLFQGNSFATRVSSEDQEITFFGNEAITIQNELLFAPHTGQTKNSATIQLSSDYVPSHEITIYASGAVVRTK